jgi:uncharacterized protein (TIGR03067 family)
LTIYIRILFVGILLFAGCREPHPIGADLSGHWALIHAEIDGDVLPDEKISGVEVEVIDESFRIYQADEVTIALGKFRMEEIFSPKHLDVWISGGDDAGMKRNGIFQLKGDTLDVCFSAPTAYRPTAFFTRKGDKKILSSWVRIDGPELEP